MISITINGVALEVEAGITIHDAATKAGFKIPTLCLYNKVHQTSCMVCLVLEQNSAKLLPSCSIPVANGMNIVTQNAEVEDARRMALELLLSEHLGDCEAPCTIACPAHMDIPRMNRLMAENKVDEALQIVKNDIPFPSILGRICQAPCEGACKRKPYDGSVSICLIKRFVGDYGVQKASAKEINTSKKVAIIGGGICGLTSAYYLQKNGVQCTVYDKHPNVGGKIIRLTPNDDLLDAVCTRDFAELRALGVGFELNKTINEEKFNLLKSQFDAVLIATGRTSGEHLLYGCKVLNGNVVTEKESYKTSLQSVFASGSALQNTPHAIKALAQGKEVAYEILDWLKIKNAVPQNLFNSRLGKLMASEFQEYLKESVDGQTNTPANGIVNGFDLKEVMVEAKRCMHCDCRKKTDCNLRTVSNEYRPKASRFMLSERKALTKNTLHKFVVFETGKCIKCGICVYITRESELKNGLTFTGRGYNMEISIALNQVFSSITDEVAHNIIKHCPTAALSYKSESQQNH